MHMEENKIIAVDMGGTFLRAGLIKGKKIIKYIKKKTLYKPVTYVDG